MQIGNKFRCYPTAAQEQTLLQWIGCQRDIYNSKVREDQYFPRFARKSLQHAGQYAPIDQQYRQFKTDLTPYLNEVPSVILRNGAVLWKQAVWLTSELFKFVPVAATNTGEITGYQLHVGIKKFPVGILAFKAHKEYKIPASIHIGIHARQWHISFNYDNNILEPSDKDTTDWLIQFSETELHKMTVGLDRGVAFCHWLGAITSNLDFQEYNKRDWQNKNSTRSAGNVVKQDASKVRLAVSKRDARCLVINGMVLMFAGIWPTKPVVRLPVIRDTSCLYSRRSRSKT